MTMPRLLLSLLALSLAGCSGDSKTKGGNDAGVTSDVSQNDASSGDEGSDDVAGDAPSVDAPSVDAPSVDVPPLGGAECIQTTTETIASLELTTHAITPSCVDPRTQLVADKPHIVYVPPNPTSGLWLHMPGSGGTPPTTTNILRTAAVEGYLVVGLAYANEPSIGTSCEGQGPDCVDKVRLERLWGLDVSDQVDVGVTDSIGFRFRRLLEFLDAQQPDAGWGAYLTDSGVDWSAISVSGFSQGGGMAGLISRDHLVARAMHLSVASDTLTNYADDPATAPECAPDNPCAEGDCCNPETLVCEAGTTGRCIFAVPARWARAGADTDGDGFGDGDHTTRATPANRHFALGHRDEPALPGLVLAMELWGVDAFGDFADADAGSPPYGGTHLLSSGLPPNGDSCSEHQSMGNDFCQPKDGAVPAMLDAWRYMMTAPITP